MPRRDATDCALDCCTCTDLDPKAYTNLSPLAEPTEHLGLGRDLPTLVHVQVKEQKEEAEKFKKKRVEMDNTKAEFFLWQIFHVRQEIDEHQKDIDDMHATKVGLSLAITIIIRIIS